MYKYFPDVEAILTAWHERQITSHLDHLVDVAAQEAPAGARLESVLEAYALIQHALTAAGGLPSEAAVHRLLAVTLAGLRRDRI